MGCGCVEDTWGTGVEGTAREGGAIREESVGRCAPWFEPYCLVLQLWLPWYVPPMDSICGGEKQEKESGELLG